MQQNQSSKFTGWNIALALASIVTTQGRSIKLLSEFFPGANLNHVFPAPRVIENNDILPKGFIRWEEYKKKE
jgi:hypothetical protein